MKAVEMMVVKRDGTMEPVQYDAIKKRIMELATKEPRLSKINVDQVCKKVIQGVNNGISTETLDVLTAETAAGMAFQHPEYAQLASRVLVSNLHKKTRTSMEAVYHTLNEEERSVCEANLDTINARLDPSEDYNIPYFGFKTLEKSYLTRDPQTKEIVEQPQVALMRVALGIHRGDLGAVFETYEQMKHRKFTHATPTMFNAGTKYPFMSSCYLLPMHSDSISGIYDTIKTCAIISKSAGGIGLSVSNVRSKGSLIRSTGGTSNGLVPMLRTCDAAARHVDQGGGKRPGAFAAYLEPWHKDVFEFLDLKKNHGVETLRAKDLFYALWIPDLFMRRVKNDEDWTLFCPNDCPGLVDHYGEAFEALYEKYEKEDPTTVPRKVVRAQELWNAIIEAQIETGTPYMLYKDAANRKSNQKNLGTIRSSNLCTEIIQFSSADEIAVCNLASLALPSFVKQKKKKEEEEDETSGDATWQFDHEELANSTRILVRNLNKIIDHNAYPCEEAKASNLRHRPMGLGVQGLADTFVMLDFPFDSEPARQLNREIFETIYYAALEESCALAQRVGRPYDSYEGSPASQGLLQFDLWNASPPADSRWDWAALKAKIRAHGLRNSLLVAPMPTASTAQILGNNECFEPFTSNLYVRRVAAGEFAVVNKHLVARLEALGLWTEDVRLQIIAGNGSVQHIEAVPDFIKALFKTVWEMSMRTIIDMSADRAIYVDQSQSLNLFVSDPTFQGLTSMHFYAWSKGLKTGMYYLRSNPSTDAVKVTVPVEKTAPAPLACRRDDPDCLACSA